MGGRCTSSLSYESSRGNPGFRGDCDDGRVHISRADRYLLLKIRESALGAANTIDIERTVAHSCESGFVPCDDALSFLDPRFCLHVFL